MIYLLSPQITDLIDKSIEVLRDLRKPEELMFPLNMARLFHSDSESRSIFLSKSVLIQSDEILQTRKDIMALYTAREACFVGLEEALKEKDKDKLAANLKILQETSFKLLDLNEKMEFFKEKTPQLSPFNIIDDFLRTCLNIYYDLLPAEGMTGKTLIPNQIKREFEIAINEFKGNYPDETKVIDFLNDGLKGIEAAIKELETFLENNDKEALLKGIRILAAASTQIYEGFVDMDKVRTEKGYSTIIYLDNFMRSYYRFAKGEISAYLFALNIQNLEVIINFLKQEIIGFEETFMLRTKTKEKFNPLIEKKFNDLSESIEKIKAITNSTPDSEAIINTLKTNLEDFLKLKIELYQEAMEEKDFSKDYHLDELREIIKGVYAYVMPKISLELKISFMTESTCYYLSRLEEMEETEQTKEFKETLTAFLKALEETGEFLKDGNKVHLLNGMEKIEDLFDNLLKASEYFNKKEIKPKTISCLRCGNVNMERAVTCEKCGTSLVEKALASVYLPAPPVEETFTSCSCSCTACKEE